MDGFDAFLSSILYATDIEVVETAVQDLGFCRRWGFVCFFSGFIVRKRYSFW